MTSQSLFITFEGGEAVGKTSQIKLLKDALSKAHYDVIATREPGGTPKAEKIREKLLDPSQHFTLDEEIEAHFQARHDHIQKLILPALQAGKIVICDRFCDSTMVYQGYMEGKGEPRCLESIVSLQKALPVMPKRTFLLQADWEHVQRRLGERHSDGGPLDRYEQDYGDHYGDVCAGFNAIAQKEPGRIRTIDTSSRSIEDVHHEIVADVFELLEKGTS